MYTFLLKSMANSTWKMHQKQYQKLVEEISLSLSLSSSMVFFLEHYAVIL